MADLKAQLEITADASGVEVGVNKAKRSLKDLGVTAESAGKQAAQGLGAMGEGGQQAAQKVDAATRNMIGSIQRQIAALEAGSKTGSEYYKVLASQRGVDVNALKPYLDQLDQTAAKQVKAGVSAGQLNAALRGVPAQFTDIAVSLQNGQQPLTVFLQQGGQLKDMFGGIGPAAKALGGYILSLINPLTIAVGIFGALALAYKQGSEESDEYAKALILSGNAAGLTVNQLQGMAERIDVVTGTQSAAADALTQFSSASHIARENIEQFSIVALRMESTTGQAVSKTIAQFEELGKSPVEASIKLNETTNYLTASLYQQIKALEDQGRTADAAAVAQKAYAEALDDRLTKVNEHLGLLQATWRGVKSIAAEAWDAMLNIGRSDSLDTKINEVKSALDSLDKRNSAPGTLGASRDAALRSQLQSQLAILEATKKQAEADANSAKATAEQARARMQFDKDGEQFMSNQAKLQREIVRAQNEGVKAGASQAEIDKRIADIREKYKDKGAISAGLQVDKAKLGADIDAIKRANEQLTGSYANAEKIMEAQRAAGLIDDRDYYESKREFIRLTADAQADALQKEIERYQQERLTGKDRIDNERKIADAQAQIAKIREDSAAKQEAISTQEEAAANRLKVSYLTAQQAAQDYFDTLQRQQQRALDGLGKGQQSRSLDAGLNQIEDRYAGQRRDLENNRAQLELEGKFTSDARVQYEQRLAIINDFQAKSIESYTRYYQDLINAQSDWSIGASEALHNYFDESSNVAKQTENLFTDAFKGMEDALVDFTKTGKLNFTAMANSIIDDLIRIQVKKLAVDAISAASGLPGVGQIFSMLMPSGGRASGGPVSAGGLYQVNERGPELLNVGSKQYLMMGNQSGSITPNSGTEVNVQVSVDAGGTKVGGNSQQGNQLGAAIGAAVRSVIMQEKRPGGMLA